MENRNQRGFAHRMLYLHLPLIVQVVPHALPQRRPFTGEQAMPTSPRPQAVPPELVKTIHRRRFLQFGGVQLLSSGLLQLLSARAGTAAPARFAGRERKAKACILLFQVGGPYQCDTFDPKPDAPEEMRGPFRPIATRAARPAHDRGAAADSPSMRTSSPSSAASTTPSAATTRPSIAAWSAARRPIRWPSPTAPTPSGPIIRTMPRLRPSCGRAATSMPGHVIIPNVTNNGPAKSPGLLGGYLGAAYDPFVLAADPNDADFRVDAVALPTDVDAARFGERRRCCSNWIAEQRSLDVARRRDTMDTLLPASLRAVDVTRDQAGIRSRPRSRPACATATAGTRRAKARCWPGGWSRRACRSSPSSRTPTSKGAAGTRTAITTALMQGTAAARRPELQRAAGRPGCRGLLDEVLVVWMGEFGRTPRMGVRFSNNTNNVRTAATTGATATRWCWPAAASAAAR